jgi:hypothetical protein
VTNVLCLSAGNRKNPIRIVLARAAKNLLSLGAPDCPVCTGQCPVRQAGLSKVAALGTSTAVYDYNSPDCPVCIGLSGGPFTGELVILGNSSATYGYNSPDCPVSQRSAGPTVGRAICAGHVAEPTARRRHRTVRCAPDMSGAPTAPRMPTVDCAVYGKKSGTGHVRCAPDCLVRQSTEGKISLPRLLSTAPSCLGAIKGTPRRMEEYTKHSYNIPKHQDIDSAPLILCDSN